MLLRITMLTVLLGMATCCFAADERVPLESKVPEEVLVGTPPDVLKMLFPGLEMPPEGGLPEFLVPKGTVNLALKKPVTASDTRPLIGNVAFVTDGNKEGTEQSYVELGPMTQWVQIDLGKPATIHAVYLWHYYREARSYHDVIIQVANDAEFAKNVQTVYNNDQDNSSRKGIGKARPYIETYLGKLVDAKGATGRYVRLYSGGNTANDLNHYVEVEVFGTPASP